MKAPVRVRASALAKGLQIEHSSLPPLAVLVAISMLGGNKVGTPPLPTRGPVAVSDGNALAASVDAPFALPRPGLASAACGSRGMSVIVPNDDVR